MVRRAVAGLAAMVVAASVAGCDVRWETEPPVWPTPDAATVERDAFAVDMAALAQAAESADTSRPGEALAAPVVAQAATAVLDILGGVYVPYPDASPEPSPSATPTPTPAPPATLTEAMVAARIDVATVRGATDDPDIALLADSLNLTLAVAAFAATREEALAAGAADLAVEERPAPGGETAGFLPLDYVTGLDESAVTTLVLAHDQARFAYETIAARETGAQRTAALARAGIHARRAEHLAALVTTDPRAPVYQVTAADLASQAERRAFEARLELGIARAYASALPGIDAADVAWVTNGAFDAYAAAIITPGFDQSQLPVLPGVQR